MKEELKKREHFCVGKMLKIYASQAVNQSKLNLSSGAFAWLFGEDQAEWCWSQH